MGNSGNGIKAIFFDARDTLGEVDRPGHFIPYRPSTEQLLDGVKNQIKVRIGIITNVPSDQTAEQAHRMIREAELSQDPKTGRPLTIGDYIDDGDIITSHEASAALGQLVQKPDPEIYRYAAQRLGLTPAQSLFVGENLVENLGATAAGMQVLLKPSPPGREFLPALVGRIGQSATDSGRQFQALLEQEHLLFDRVLVCGNAIVKALNAITEGKAPPLDQGKWVSPGKVTLPDELRSAMAYFGYLNNHFADQWHLRSEEAMIEVAVACGMPLAHAQWVIDQHEQVRAYVNVMNVAWGRIERGDDDDRFYALIDFRRGVEGFVYLLAGHAVRENDQMFTEVGGFFNDTDDSMVMNLLTHFGPADVTPYVAMVARIEAIFGIHAPT